MKGSDIASFAIGLGVMAGVALVVVNVSNRSKPGSFLSKLTGGG